MAARWFVAQTETGDERRVCRKLAEYSVTTWIPDIQGKPVLPGYVLIQCDHIPWVVMEVPEVIRLLPFSQAPLPIPDDQIEIMRAHLRAAEAVAEQQPKSVRGEKIIAGYTATALANLLQGVGIPVTFRRDTPVELSRKAPPGRSNAGHRHRRSKRAA